MSHEHWVFQAGKGLSLDQIETRSTGEFESEEDAQESVQAEAAELARLQDILMAHEEHGLLVLVQAMDGAGKDATIKHVMAHVDPQGCEVKLFKRMGEKELRHDFLWRASQALPARGQIGIFNRSYYEQVIADRIHPEALEEQHLPPEVREGDIWARRFRHINNFEQYLVENGIHVLKFFLHLSKEEQRERLLERIARPDKKWKFSESDIRERGRWDEYMEAFQAMLENTSTGLAPWYVIPADHRWFARATVASVIVAKLRSLHGDYPELSDGEQRELDEAREQLEKEK